MFGFGVSAIGEKRKDANGKKVKTVYLFNTMYNANYDLVKISCLLHYPFKGMFYWNARFIEDHVKEVPV